MLEPPVDKRKRELAAKRVLNARKAAGCYHASQTCKVQRPSCSCLCSICAQLREIYAQG